MLDQLLSLIAPYDCISCGAEGRGLCDACFSCVPSGCSAVCIGCSGLAVSYELCKTCRKTVPLEHAWVLAEYQGAVKDALKAFKFGHKRGMAKELAARISEFLPVQPQGTIVVYIPTSTSRVRQRGFDHAALLAKELSKKQKLMYAGALKRVSQNRQLGSSRSERFKNVKGSFVVTNPNLLLGAHILLVDDVATTGATLFEAARVLRRAGASTIDAVVVAHTITVS